MPYIKGTKVRRGLLIWMCFQGMNKSHAMEIQWGGWGLLLGFNPGPDIVVKVIEAEFHRQHNEYPGRQHKVCATLGAAGFQISLN